MSGSERYPLVGLTMGLLTPSGTDHRSPWAPTYSDGFSTPALPHGYGVIARRGWSPACADAANAGSTPSGCTAWPEPSYVVSAIACSATRSGSEFGST